MISALGQEQSLFASVRHNSSATIILQNRGKEITKLQNPSFNEALTLQ
tara:strand:- start:250 stop:393 length:144 start_codon:yes stop_codon:yes gene_type:complete